MSDKQKALICLVLAAVLWSSGGVLIKWVEWSPMAIAGIRSIIAALVIGIAFRHEKLTFSKVQWAGAAAYCSTVFFFVTATKMTTAANAILLQYTAPIYVALLGGWLLSERADRRDWLTIGVVVAGMIFFFIDKLSGGAMTGNLLAIASGVSFALCIVCLRMQKNGSPHGSILLGNLLTFIISIPFLSGISLSTSNIVGIIVLGVFQLGLAYVLYSYAIRHINALQATLITTIEPILNPIWVFLVLGEVPGQFAIIGGLIVVSAITLRYYLDTPQSAKEEAVI
ncbi:DMT family transporter [Dendrosporobacter sp. 1207_IL3150]|uniref:DMT family transporter n=1 Tax=Dendrosporobacter sp. 1207_IL3150 TaxID=3084054 RepID=UPI002FD8B397